MTNVCPAHVGHAVTTHAASRDPAITLRGNLMKKAQAFFVRADGNPDTEQNVGGAAAPGTEIRRASAQQQGRSMVMERLASKARELVTGAGRPRSSQGEEKAVVRQQERKALPPKKEGEAGQNPKSMPQRPFEKVSHPSRSVSLTTVSFTMALSSP